jgi:hypothetical protein
METVYIISLSSNVVLPFASMIRAEISAGGIKLALATLHSYYSQAKNFGAPQDSRG